MAELKCPYDDNAKDYVIPTKSWLRAIEQLNPNDISAKGQIITAELINKEKVLVKVTSGKSAKLRNINGKIKQLPNLVFTYCVIFCNDYLPVILKNKYFCGLSESKYKVTLEVMKMYNGGSINNLSSITLLTFKSCLEQLVLCQINLLAKTGLTHCNIHPGNLLINKLGKEKELVYGYLTEPVKIKTKYEFILSDYDKSVDFSPQSIGNFYISEPDSTTLQFDLTETIADLVESTLYKNICRTCSVLIEKLEPEFKQTVKSAYGKFHGQIDDVINKKEKKYLTTYIYGMNKNSNNKIDQFIQWKNAVVKLNLKYWKLLNEIIIKLK